MTMDKVTTESTPHGGTRRLDRSPGDRSTMPRQQIELPALEIEDDDCGGDPYNRTGQFYLADLKKRDKQ
jgi:hypothetical protein